MKWGQAVQPACLAQRRRSLSPWPPPRQHPGRTRLGQASLAATADDHGTHASLAHQEVLRRRHLMLRAGPWWQLQPSGLRSSRVGQAGRRAALEHHCCQVRWRAGQLRASCAQAQPSDSDPAQRAPACPGTHTPCRVPAPPARCKTQCQPGAPAEVGRGAAQARALKGRPTERDMLPLAGLVVPRQQRLGHSCSAHAGRHGIPA